MGLGESARKSGAEAEVGVVETVGADAGGAAKAEWQLRLMKIKRPAAEKRPAKRAFQESGSDFRIFLEGERRRLFALKNLNKSFKIFEGIEGNFDVAFHGAPLTARLDLHLGA